MKKLVQAIEEKHSPCVVGLDPTEQLIPPQILQHCVEQMSEDSDRINSEWFVNVLALSYEIVNKCIIDAVHDIVPAVKPQIAMYEALGIRGLQVYRNTCKYAQEQGLYVLGDIKRGDIGSTATAYAKHITDENVSMSMRTTLQSFIQDLSLKQQLSQISPCPVWYEDAVTVNPYLGSDGIQPFIDVAKQYNKDIFVLIRTSNPSSSQIQELTVQDGVALYKHVGHLVEAWGADTVDSSQYSCVGAVVGATHPQQGEYLRTMLPHTFFLVPGYGAQGGTADQVSGMFDDNGRGALVNSSRGICSAWKKSTHYSAELDYNQTCRAVYYASQQAALHMRNDIVGALHTHGKRI